MITLISSTRRALACAILPALALLLGACSAPYRPPRFVEPDPKFPGLIDLAARADGRVADVLLVHGMCTHDAGWATQVVSQLAEALADATTPPDARPRGGPAADPRIRIVPSTVETPAGR
jgi:hypothetical protein